MGENNIESYIQKYFIRYLYYQMSIFLEGTDET